MIIAGYGKTLVGMPEGSPFSMTDLATLAYLIDSMDRGEEWTRFDYRKAEDDLWDARGGSRATLRARLRLLVADSSRRRRSVSRASMGSGRSTR